MLTVSVKNELASANQDYYILRKKDLSIFFSEKFPFFATS